ncbi:O-Antigen ligase [Candidatus Arsenophonus lipoptenae]|uniref:O-Antigen ligase n=1 Tax=Candidatus Arsenophonus lipoptenae TaxID=634113 RepID=A0A0X9WA12_9GAMM|nr:O-antigen ligase RfaL [Candidatus Arsenophonus lipoptenae]AMA64718.1 O-Antigen ligase [Candidatus Arsenophonus lipoptenae]
MKSIPTINKKFSYRSYWNLGIVFFFIVIYFADGITRYKHILTGLIYFTAIISLIMEKRTVFNMFKNNLFLSLIFFVVAILYSLIISRDINISIKAFNKEILEKLFINTIAIAIVLYREKKENITNLLIFSLVFSILPLTIKEIRQYINEYHQGILPLSTFEHRYISDWLIFIMPSLLSFWLYKNTKSIILFLLLSLIFVLITIGTLQRGTWLSITIVFIIWCLIKKEIQLPNIAIILLSILLIQLAIINQGQYDKLFYKLKQMDSSHRYCNGTQDSALDLIKDNPIIGYGYGEQLFYKIYNERVIDYPEWIFKQSIGPHNTILSIWFAAGILGLVAILYFFISTFIYLLKKYRNNKIKDGFLILMLIFIGDIIIRGLFETVHISNMSVIIGIALALNGNK